MLPACLALRLLAGWQQCGAVEESCLPERQTEQAGGRANERMNERTNELPTA